MLEERIGGLTLSEQRASSALSDATARIHEQKNQHHVCYTQRSALHSAEVIIVVDSAGHGGKAEGVESSLANRAAE